MKIIEMTQEHVKRVAELEAACFSMPWSEKTIAGELTNPLSLWLVATDDDCVVGYIGSQSVMGQADMMNIAVDSQFRRQGVAGSLVDALICRLCEKKVTSLTLEVRVSNDAAINLYAAKGFTEVGRRPNYYSRPKEDALILRKEWCL